MAPLETSFREIWIKILTFSFKKMRLKMSSDKMAAILSRGRWVKNKVEFRESEFYKEREGINWGQSYLHGVFRTSSLNWHIRRHSYTAYLNHTFFNKHSNICMYMFADLYRYDQTMRTVLRSKLIYNRNTLWLRDTVRQTSRGKSAAAGPTAGRPRPLTSRGMSAWPYRVTTKYSFYPVRTFKMLNKK